MSELDPIHIAIIATCFAVAYVIILCRRFLGFVLFQILSVVLFLGGVLICISGSLWPSAPWIQPVDDYVAPFLNSIPDPTMRLFGAMVMFSGVPIAVVFRELCFWAFPWLKVYTYPRAMRDAFLNAGVDPPRRRGFDRWAMQFVVPHIVAVVLSVLVLGPLIVLHINGMSELASRVLERLSDLGLIVFCFGMCTAGLRGVNRANQAA